MQQTSKWQTHLPYLYLETLRVHNSFLNTVLNSRKKPALGRHLEKKKNLNTIYVVTN